MKNRPSIWPKLKSFRNSYLALATVLAILLQFTASAQVDTLRVRQKINAYGYDYKNVAVDSSFKLPVDTFRLRVSDKGSIAYKDTCLYVWTGSRWRSIWCDGGGATGGGGGSPAFAFTVQPQSATVASGTFHNLTATVTGGVSPYTWSWRNITYNSNNSNGGTGTSNTIGFTFTETQQFSAVVTDNTGNIIRSDTVTITVSAPPVAIAYGYSATNPYVDNSTAPTISNSASANITSGADISLTFAAAASGKYIVIREPSTEPIKTKWFVESLNSGDIPDQAFRAAFVVGGFRYYVTRDVAGFAFDTSKPLQLLKN